MRLIRPFFLFAAALILTAEEWPGFRGPGRQGVSQEKGIPVEFGPEKNLAWKTPVPGEGWSSPVIWRERVYLTTATESGASCRVLALDARTGRLLWDREIARQQTKRKEKKNSYASPTPVTDGRAVYCVCGDGTFAAVDGRGRVLWTNRDYPHYSQHGLGSSPLLVDDLLIMARDGSAESGDLKVGWQKPWDQSYVVALDRKTGKQRWKTRRGLSRIAHVTPNVMGEVLVSGAGDVVQGFNVQTGKLLWTGTSQGEGVVPSIVVGDGLIYTVSGFEKPTIRAFRPGGEVAWEQTKGVPMIPSLVHVSPYLYSITTNGIAHCFDARTGAVVWQNRVGGNFSASPVWVDGKLLLTSEEGEIIVIQAGNRFEEIARNRLGEMIQASPAISGGRLLIRTAGTLWCFQKRP